MKLGMLGDSLVHPFRLLKVFGPMVLLLGVLGMVVACGSDEPTTTSTEASSSVVEADDAVAEEAAADDAVAEEADDGTYTGLSADFASKDVEINMPAYRHTAWNATTLKRLIEDEYPNVTVTLNSSTTNEVLQDVDDVIGYRSGAFMTAPTAQWVGHRGGEAWAIPDGVPNPGGPAFAGWGVYPMSQYIVQAMADSGINTTADLDGKTFLPGQYANDPRTIIQVANIQATGAKPRVVYSTQRSNEALLERAVDSVHSGMVYQVSLAGAGVTMAQQNEIRIVEHPKSAIDKVRAETPSWEFNIPMRMCNNPLKSALSIDYDIILSGSLDVPGDNCIGGVGGLGLGTWVFEEMDPDIMYIMIRTQIEHADEFLTVYPGAPWVGTIWTEIFGHYVLPQEFFHPGAAAAYEEFGKTYGLEGRAQWLSERTDPDQWWLDFLPE